MQKRAKLFRNGRSQAVRLPKEFRFTGTEVNVERRGNSVVLTPVEGRWAILARTLRPLSEEAGAALEAAYADRRARPRKARDVSW